MDIWVKNMAFPLGWSYRKSHLIDFATGAGAGYQVGIKVYKSAGTDGTESVNGTTFGKVYVGTHCRDDFGDIRFTDDLTVELNYFMESYVSGTSAIFWVKVSADLSTDNQTIYIYYGSSGSTTTSSGDNTFNFFDDFNASPNGWTLQNGGTISGGNFVIPVGTPAVLCVGYKARPASFDSYRFRGKVTCAGSNSGWYVSARGFSTYAVPVYRVYDYYYNPFTAQQLITQGNVTLANLSATRDANTHYFEYTKAGSAFVEKWDALTGTGTDATAETGTYVSFGYWGTLNAVANIDWVFLSQFVSPEPAHSTWGSEESLVTLSGVTRDTNGNVLGSCTVYLFRASDLAYFGTVTSDAVTGAYSFGVTGSTNYFVVAFKSGTPDVQGVTDKNLQGA